MAESTTHPTSAQRTVRDRGFTLVETLIVTITIGIITAAIATAITVVLRNTPPTEVRADDARSVQGLVTWLPQDVDAAPPNGFNRDPGFWPCAGSPSADESYNVVSAGWRERAGITQKFAASYRYEREGESWSIRRYACEDGGTGTMGPADRINLTSDLPPWNAGSPPAFVTMCSSAVDAGGSCPAGDVIPAGIMQPDPDINGYAMRSLKLSITRFDGVVATIDAAPKNPDQDLADDPYASTNHEPEVSVTNVVIPMQAGQTLAFSLTSTHNPTDSDGDPISAAIDSTEVMPPGLSVLTSDPLNVEVTTDPSMTVGTVTDKVVLIVSDNRAGWVDATFQIQIVPAINNPPTQTAFNYDLNIVPGTDVVLPIDVTHGISDPDGDPLTATVISHPTITLASPPQFNQPGPLDLRVKAAGGAPIGTTALTPILFEVSDGVNPPIAGTITVHFVAAPNNPPTATTTDISVDMFADDSLSFSLADPLRHGISDPDGDPLSIVDINDPGGVTTVEDGGLNVTINTDLGLAVGTLGDVQFDVEDIHGERVSVRVTVNIIASPPLPTVCELTDLVASPSPVDRHAQGSQPHLLVENVTVTLTYIGSCDGLTLTYDSGDTTGLGIGTGRIFPNGSPTSIVIVSKDNGGTEKWSPGVHVLTASTTSAIAIPSITTTLTVD